MSGRKTYDLYKLLDGVHDQATFLDFIYALSIDWEEEETNERELSCETGQNGWVNGTIGAFLECAQAWGKGQPDAKRGAANAWRRAAEILYAGKFYE